MEGLVGSRFVRTPSLAWFALGLLAYFVAGGVLAWSLSSGLVRGTPAAWPALAGLAAAAAVAAFVLFMRRLVRYVSWERPRARLGLPHAAGTVRYRDSMRLNWGMMGKDPQRVVDVLHRITGRTGTISAEAKAETPALARLLRRRLAVDVAVSLVLAAALVAGILALRREPWMFPVVMALALLSQPLSIFLNAFRYQDPWLAWYKRHFL